jgi:diguanylate cyclase
MTWDTIWITLYTGLILTNLLFALFMLISLRELELLYYIAFLLLHHVFAILMLEGVPARVFGIDNLFWNKTGLIFLINAAITSALLFSTSFLKLQQNFPSYYRMSRILLVLMVISMVQTLLLPHFLGAAISTIILTIVGAGILLTCIKCASKKDPIAQLFLLSWSAGIGGATIYSLKIWGLLPVNSFTDNAWHFGTAIEAILFSYTIAHRVTIERRMRLDTQTELAHHERALRLAQEKLLRTETAAKEVLEQEVQERTRDITRILGELEHQNQQLVELSINDGLTKVRNRRYFNEAYPALWQEAMAKHCSIGVILLDIDHFKSVNDNYGHLLGDQCLIKVAELMKQIVSRPKDIICRYGGEEFIIVLFDTDQDSSSKVAERLRQKTSELAVPMDNGTDLYVTVSLGVGATIPDPSQDPMELIDQCDQALYAAKAAGRNRVIGIHELAATDQLNSTSSSSASASNKR